MKLISTQDLTIKVGATRYAVEAALKDLKLKPIYEMKQGKGTVDIWDEDAVLQPIMDELRKREAAKAPPQAALPLVTPPDMKPVFEEVFKLARRVDDSLDEFEKTNEDLLATVKRLTDQNVTLLRMFEDIRATAYLKIDALQATVDLLPDLVRKAVEVAMTPEPESAPAPTLSLPPAPAPAVAKKPTEPEKAKLKVAIVALLNDQQTMIKKEFGEVLDLRMFEGSETHQSGFANRVSNCDVAFVMNNFTDRIITDQIKKSGVKVVRVGGGLTRLRDELTNLFINA